MINLKVIKELNPCQDRLDNYVKFYKDKDFTPNQFLGLKNITQADKMWVSFRLMRKYLIPLAAADIAESVLHIYEKAYPNDFRPRNAIAAARGKGTAAYATSAANAAVAYDAAYTYAVYSAAAYAYATTTAAYSAAAYATTTTAYAVNAYAVNAYAVNADQAKQEKLNRKICLKYLKESEK